MAATFIQKRGRILGSLTKAATFIENMNDETESEEIESRLAKVESWWEEFYNIEDELLLLPQQTSKSDEFEAKFFSIQGALTREMKKRRQIEPNRNDDLNATLANMCSQQRTYLELLHNKTTSHGNEVKLPKINIPSFNGEYTQWPSFKARLINHFLITDASYEEAWDKLKHRYDKKRTIVSTIVKTFIDQPCLTQASAKSLRNLTETSDELLRGLKALGPECQSRDPWILHLLLNKMDDETKQHWALHSVSMDSPKVDDFLNFLHQRCDALESCNITMKPPKSVPRVSHIATNKIQCKYCDKPHPISRCYKFQKCDIEFRKNFVSKHDLCMNCLRLGHTTNNCQSTNTCFKCKARHHTILHEGNSCMEPPQLKANVAIKEINYESTSQGKSTNNELHTYTATTSLANEKKQSILPTVVTSYKDALGNIHDIRALLDSGSESTFITEALTRKLGLKRRPANVMVSGLSSVSAGKTKGQVNVKITSRYDTGKFVVVDALVLGKITNYIPSQAITLQEYSVNQLEGVCLADPNFFKSNPIDMILGIDIFYDVVLEGRKVIQPNLHLLDSIFGWVIAGNVDQGSNSTTGCYTIQTSADDISQLLQRFWEVEEISTDSISRDDECEVHFSKTHQFVNNRYTVELPFKENFENLGNSLRSATSRLIGMERKFQRDSQLKEEYTKFMREYEKLGHMTLIPDSEISTNTGQVYYLPHHAVFKVTDSSKKLRVVFDGSCKSSSGLSLNDVLRTGTTIQDDLFTILTRFRRHEIGFVADIEKMYRQVKVHQTHQNYQRILWRETPNTEMKHFKLTTVTYGLTCSAFLAIRSLHQIGRDIKESSPELATVIQSDFYVDDLLSGCSTIEEATTRVSELSNTLSKAGFKLRQWSSSSQELLNKIPVENQGKESVLFEDPERYVKTLGISWLTRDDAFTFNVPVLHIGPSTKRGILSECGKIFDPLGWLSPATVTFKILLQSLWLTKLSWDDPLSDSLNQHWCKTRNELTSLTGVRIPRFVHTQSTQEIQFHGFCDASEKAYSAVVYVRSTNSSGEILVNLIAAKTKVAPLKQISLPRLELCGAVLLTKLLHKIARIFDAPVGSVYAWTDSNIVLAWISDIPRKWNCFVANRTSYILEKLPLCHWQHVPTKLNPADCASRGLSPKELIHHNIWWEGPEYLRKSTNEWPNQLITTFPSTSVERKKTILMSTNAGLSTYENSSIKYIIEQFSSYTMMLRVISNCVRFAELCLKEKVPYITVHHMQRCEEEIIKWVQKETFYEEINDLRSNKAIKRSSKLLSLYPIIDENGLLRVGGRLINSNVGYSTKHPIILPRHHQLTEKLVRYLHLKYLHPNPSTLTFLTKSRYWIIGCKDIIKKITNSCVQCIRSRPRISEQIMGSLPIPRVTLIRPFYNVGVDYAGPIAISSKKGRGSKRSKAYIALFVCMATKAMHVEVVSDLTTDGFIAALKRFTGRRGLPNAIYSDNATNFVGARRKLEHFFALVSSKSHNARISTFTGTNNIEWHTIPPSAPHFGGLWEAGVKSIKTHLRRVLGESAPTLEELLTLLIQVEAIVNSRPLTPVNNDPDDLHILTPGHFLIGTSMLEVPDKGTNDITLKLQERWELLQNMVRGFWKRWHVEYLTTLQKRSKWQHQHNNYKEGELVLIKDDNSSTLSWARGRVVKVHPGQDGVVRVVTLKTSTGELKRPVTKLVKLTFNS